MMSTNNVDSLTDVCDLRIRWIAFCSCCAIFTAMLLGCSGKPAPVEVEKEPDAPEIVLPGEAAESEPSESEPSERDPSPPHDGDAGSKAKESTAPPSTEAMSTATHLSVERSDLEKTDPSQGSVEGILSAEPNGSLSPLTVTLGDPRLTSGIPGDGPLTTEEVRHWISNPEHHRVLDLRLPMGLAAAAPSISGIEENPLTLAKVELGRQLYFDTRLSADGTISCASCHDPRQGFSQHSDVGIGIKNQRGNRNSPVTYNRLFSSVQFWDGRADNLEEQAMGPMANPIEMGNTHENVVATVNDIEGYRVAFEKVFPGEGVTIDTIAKAIASFERVLVTGPAPYDYLELMRSVEKQYAEDELEDLQAEDPELYEQYLEAKAVVAKLSESAIRGRDLFFSERANCTACHAGANFTDELYHNLGVGMESEQPDLGRFVETNEEKDKGAFKTPTLRNVAASAPYMHDGSQKTLEEVVDWYVRGGHPNPWLSDKIKKLDLTDQEKADLVAFMREALTGSFPVVELARLPE